MRVAALLLLIACAPRSPAPAVAGTDPVWRYEVRAGPGAEVLAIEASFPPGTAPDLTVDRGLEHFADNVTAADRPVERDGDRWHVPECRGGCRIAYTFALGAAAAATGDARFAESFPGGLLVAPPSTWLLRPAEVVRGPRYRFRVETPPELRFVTGVAPAAEPDTYEAEAQMLRAAPFSAFGPLDVHALELAGGRVEVALVPGALRAGDDRALAWAGDAATDVAGYFGRFPVDRVLVLLAPARGRGFGFGTTLGNGGASIFMRVGADTAPRAFAEDWQMTHEMVHLAFPNLPRAHRWLEEGVATYVEPLARARTGRISSDAMWRELMLGLPRGQPEPGDRGLDGTPTWGRTYWGGALFCFLADLEIRERTGNGRALDDALAAILAEGGNVTVGWSLERTLAIGDRATGTDTLAALYARLGRTPVEIDLDAIWGKLGVRLRDGAVELDDGAPLAAIRHAMTRSRATAARAGLR